MQSNWYEHFFHGLALEFWHKAMTEDQTRSEVDFIVSCLNLPTGARILDIPCGNGRHTLALSQRGYSATGVDLSAEFIGDARGAAAEKGVIAQWVIGDMRHLSLRTQFDGVVCFGNSFGYLSHEDTIAFIDNIAACLKRDGRFILETGLAAESLLPNVVPRRWFQIDELLMLSESRYVAAESRLYTSYTFIRGTVKQTGTAAYSIYTVAEIKRLLSAAGFQVEDLFGTPQRQSYELGSPRLFVVARKIR